MHRRGIRVGKRETLKLYYVFLTGWALIAVVTIVMAVATLPTSRQPVDYLVNLSQALEQTQGDW